MCAFQDAARGESFKLFLARRTTVTIVTVLHKTLEITAFQQSLPATRSAGNRQASVEFGKSAATKRHAIRLEGILYDPDA
ncbi:MAG: hypothetical protein C0483_07795 [Pirellula sp.]|nr:hypothetical protein [Pirellula sp.]